MGNLLKICESLRQFGYCNCVVRQQNQKSAEAGAPVSRKLVLTVLKNEGAFLLDWVAYHLALGFEHFLLFTNHCDDGTDAIAARLEKLGLATHHDLNDFGNRGPQWAALNHESTRSIPHGDWIYVTDVDEYLVVHSGDGTVEALLSAGPAAEAISVPWRFFGSSGLLEYEDQPVRERFRRTAPYPLIYPRQAHMFKTLYRHGPSIQKPGVHAPRLKSGWDWRGLAWVNGSGKRLDEFDPKTPILAGPNAGIGLAQINHYALRSAKSFLVKAARGLANRKSAKIDLTYWMRRNFNALGDRSIDRLAAPTADRLAAFQEDPTLARLHIEACRWHREEAERLASSRAGVELLSGIYLAGDSRVLTLEEARPLYHYHRALRDAEAAS